MGGRNGGRAEGAEPASSDSAEPDAVLMCLCVCVLAGNAPKGNDRKGNLK